jgi:hypothetical protein
VSQNHTPQGPHPLGHRQGVVLTELQVAILNLHEGILREPLVEICCGLVELNLEPDEDLVALEGQVQVQIGL